MSASPEQLKQALKQEEHSFFGFFIRKFRLTYLLLISIILLGLLSMLTMPKEAEPEIQVPYAVINTIYTGAAPNDIEKLITDKIEDKIKNLDNLKNYTSSSALGLSSIFVEFEAKADLQDSFQKLKDAIDQAQPNLPTEAEDPYTFELNITDYPLITYSLVGDYPLAQMKEYADIIQTKFESIATISKVNIMGGLEREYQVLIEQTQLNQFNLSLNQVIAAINSNNFNLPAGIIEIDDYKYNVRVQGEMENINDLAETVVLTQDNTPVLLKEIAKIKDSFKEKNTDSHISVNKQKPQNTISLQVYKKTGGNILKIIDQTNAAIEDLKQQQQIPTDLTILKTNDNSVFIKDDLRRLSNSGLQTMLFIAILLITVLGWRSALITSLSVPIAFLMAFVVLAWQNQTLNSMVLFSLVLSLGLMVDNSIIIMEGINEYQMQYKCSPYQAALLSVWNYKWPIIAGTMTTVSAFLPMLLVSGIMGQYISILPKTITATLLSSLLVALIILPTLTSRFTKHSKNTSIQSAQNTLPQPKKRWLHKLIHNLQHRYAQRMHNILINKAKRKIMISLAWLVFLAGIALPGLGIMQVQMFPKVDLEYFVVNIELPVGSSLNRTAQVAAQGEQIIIQIPELDNFVTNIGTSASVGLTGQSTSDGSHLASITVNLTDKKTRQRKSYDIADSIRPALADLTQGRVKVEELAAGPPTGAPFEARIYGPELHNISTAVEQVKSIAQNLDGLINITNSIEDSTGEFTFSLKKEQANYYGLNVMQVAGIIRTALHGQTASTVNLNGQDIDIMVKYQNNHFTDISDLQEILISTSKGLITLKQIADIELYPSLVNIQHKQGQRVALVQAMTRPGANIQTITQEFEEQIAKTDLPDNIHLEIGGEMEDIEKSFKEIFLSMILAIILIALILVLQFDSFKQPFIIIFTLPLGIIGVMVGLTALRLPFSFPAFIGLVSLAGIVVNDAIVLIDKINKNLKNGQEFFSSIIQAGLARMQPIFLTTATTIVGVLPLALREEMWQGLGFTIIFGLLFATILTLIMVPIMYASLCYKDWHK